MIGWKSDKAWSDRFIPEITSILGQVLIGPAPVEDDQEKNTDFIVLKMDAVRIGCRIRRPGSRAFFESDFTIRSGRPSGVKTELAKIIEGWGDYFFYGIGSDDEARLDAWRVCSLKVFRGWFMRELARRKGEVPGSWNKNHERGGSTFHAFKWSDMPSDFIVASSDTHPTYRQAA